MLGILAAAFGVATRTHHPSAPQIDNRTSREKLAAQRRWDDEYFWQGRSGTPGDGYGR
ncbi:MAG: hypothetical protein U1A24_09470 [Cypionkella sp.]|uniref:hypothetical protein n=1 Tax=Cypionkella sp. TaxID=2811411 RepID=UPI002ABA98A1|nr:hypothetical protein [Cypionkella sp.]MDZ4310767.1 hypothetical protein [Cypionkella sp.]